MRALGIPAGGEHRHLRVRSLGKSARGWSAWTEVPVNSEEGTLVWLEEPSTQVEVQGAGDGRLMLIDPGVTPVRPVAQGDPAIVPRSQWCPAPFVCPAGVSPSVTRPTHLVVHHTAGSNTATDYAAVMRAIWELHVRGNGWADIGYNFLVAPDGTAFEGRGDGILGAHFSAVNTGTAGISMMGTFTGVAPTDASVRTLAELLTWQAAKYGLDPLGTARHAASGLDLYVISGHRDAGLSPQASGRTECPGVALYPLLPEVRDEVCRRMPGCVPRRERPNTCAGVTGVCLSADGIVNTATYDARPVARGSIAAAFGTQLAGLTARVNGRAATVSGSTANQVNFLVPANTEPGISRLELLEGSTVRASRLFAVTEAAPAVYVGINHDSQNLNGRDAPVGRGRALTLYVTGAASGLAWSASVGGVVASPLFLGPAPGFPGVWQTNLVVPESLTPGAHPLVLTVSGVASAPFSIQVN